MSLRKEEQPAPYKPHPRRKCSKTSAALPAILLRMLSAPDGGWLTIGDIRLAGLCSRASAYRHISRLEAVGWPVEREWTPAEIALHGSPEQRFRVPYAMRARDGSDDVPRETRPPRAPVKPGAPLIPDTMRKAAQAAREAGRPCAHYFPPNGGPCAFCTAPAPTPQTVGGFILAAADALADGVSRGTTEA